MNFLKKATVATLLVCFLALSSSASAEETMQHTMQSTLYGGVIGALLGGALVLLSDTPEDNLDYIASGAGVGLLVGAAYGIASSGVVESLGKVEDGEFKFGLPLLKRKIVFDKNVNSYDVTSEISLLKVKF
jgi:O-antigen/teichoic acid export membrane protein